MAFSLLDACLENFALATSKSASYTAMLPQHSGLRQLELSDYNRATS